MPAPIHLSATKHKADTKSVGMSTRLEVAGFCAMLPNSCQLTQCQIIITAPKTSNLMVTGQLLKLKHEKLISFQEFKDSYLHIQDILA